MRSDVPSRSQFSLYIRITMDVLILLLGLCGLFLIWAIVLWLNPRPKPPEDEWAKWKDD